MKSEFEITLSEGRGRNSKIARLVSVLLSTPVVGAGLAWLLSAQTMAGDNTGPA